jgi:hypothetical protein
VRRAENPKFTQWLQEVPRDVFVAVEADIRYLLEFGRGAALPFVRHRIQESSHFPDMSETRTAVRDDSGREWIVRTLAVFADSDSVLAFCVAGDKRQWADANPSRDWYSVWVPVADAVFRWMKDKEGWK